MNTKQWAFLFTLAALWGGSFLFIRVGAPTLGPVVLMWLRVGIASAALGAFAALSRRRPAVAGKWKSYLVLGLLNAAVPFSLIAAAELRLSSSLAAILNATTPLFTALVTRVWTGDPLTPRKAGGLVLGILGVAVLVGWEPDRPDGRLLVSAAMSLLAACSYAVAGVYAARAFKGEHPLDMAIGQQLAATVILLPFACAALPRAAWSPVALMAVAALAVLCTAVAYLFFFALIRDVGPVRALSVTLLVPVFGTAWGALFLGEPLSWNVIAGLALVLCSVALVARAPAAPVGRPGAAASPAR